VEKVSEYALLTVRMTSRNFDKGCPPATSTGAQRLMKRETGKIMSEMIASKESQAPL